MIVGDTPQWPLVHLLLCASDIARGGYSAPLTEASIRVGLEPFAPLAIEARAEAQAVAPRVFEYRNELLAEILLEAAYRVAANQGVSGGVA